MIKIGDKIIVSGRTETPAFVANIIEDTDNARTKVLLDWGHLGSSVVYLHDENHYWYKYSGTN